VPPIESTAAANRLLAALPREVRRRLLAACEPVELMFAQVLVEADARIRHVYFPTRSFVSLLTPLAGLEVGLVGDEGMVGISLALGVSVSPLRALVQSGGPALRIGAAAFCREYAASPALQRLLQRYVYVLRGQLVQMAACARFHRVPGRLARRLLMTQDRAHSDAFYVTHEFLAQVLGVRRVGVTRAATFLRRHGLIRYTRGHVTVLDRDGLEAASCGCYAADREIYSRMTEFASSTSRSP